jgi:hypothetical protein
VYFSLDIGAAYKSKGRDGWNMLYEWGNTNYVQSFCKDNLNLMYHKIIIFKWNLLKYIYECYLDITY